MATIRGPPSFVPSPRQPASTPTMGPPELELELADPPLDAPPLELPPEPLVPELPPLEDDEEASGWSRVVVTPPQRARTARQSAVSTDWYFTGVFHEQSSAPKRAG
jgi:hypothetical protein